MNPIQPFKLLDPTYLLDLRPGSDFLYFWPLLILFLLIFLLSFRVHYKHLPARLREFAVLGLLLTFFRDQNLPYLGMRLGLVLLFLAAVIYAVLLWKRHEREADLRPFQSEKENKLNRYLPQPKSFSKRAR